MMTYSGRNWPHWDLNETTNAEICRFLENNREEPKEEACQEVQWLLRLMPPTNPPDEEEKSEWESDDDDDDDKFPEAPSSHIVFLRDASHAESEKGVCASKFEPVPMIGDLEGKTGQSLSLTSEKHTSGVQQGINITSLLKIFNEEKCSEEKKMKELNVLENVENSVLITFIVEASVTIKCDEKKSDFCLLLSQILKDKSFLLGQHFYLPWFQNLGKKANVPASSLSDTISLFTESACEDILLPLLNSPESYFLEDPHALKDVLALSDPKCWIFLLRKFLDLLNREKLAEWHLPALEFICHQIEEFCDSLTENVMNNLANLLLAHAVDFSQDRYFGSIILFLIGAVKKNRAISNSGILVSQLSSILQFYKGPSKFKANMMLKKLAS